MDKRFIIQIGASIASNAHIAGFMDGSLYKGSLKSACVPGLNCYSCPGAIGSCPIGSLQAVSGGIGYTIPLYVLGIMTVFGALMGRFICGFLCPFGFIQEILHRIPSRKVRFAGRMHGLLKYMKYAMLFIAVLLLPAFAVDEFGNGVPFFCEYVCPAGILEGGIPLMLANPSLRNAIGLLFAWKMAILVSVLVISVFLYRPFCKYVCPLGAFYGFFNRISAYRLTMDMDKCTGCGSCSRSCRMEIDVVRNHNSAECVRCGDCVKACPESAIGTQIRII